MPVTMHAHAQEMKFVLGQEVAVTAIHLAATSAISLGANNSFKPSPLRGLVAVSLAGRGPA